jgi:hypothetical protein
MKKQYFGLWLVRIPFGESIIGKVASMVDDFSNKISILEKAGIHPF